MRKHHLSNKRMGVSGNELRLRVKMQLTYLTNNNPYDFVQLI